MLQGTIGTQQANYHAFFAYVDTAEAHSTVFSQRFKILFFLETLEPALISQRDERTKQYVEVALRLRIANPALKALIAKIPEIENSEH